MHCRRGNAQVVPIDMTCIDITIEDLFSCSFGISKAKAVLLVTLMDEKDWTTVASVASRLGKDRSVVQRELASLHGKGLVSREQRNKPSGGFEFLYKAKDRRAIKGAISEKSRAFFGMIKGKLDGW